MGTCSIPSTGNYETWETIICDVQKIEGKHDLYLKFASEGEKLYHFNWWKFNK
ncbi:carbohydrate-binding protein [Lutibacter agarilyticus]|uniref:carbohydrate-binding protein n=1 Tax=Lutibacter agarilyticus TaxID=1109740 RepID=UPI00374441D6